jgi:hypothetical protein
VAATVDADAFEDVPNEARGLIRQSAIMAAAAKVLGNLLRLNRLWS